MLDPRIARTLYETYNHQLSAGELLSTDQLATYYATFRARFGPDVLAGLDGEALLRHLHDLGKGKRSSLAYWLEFKNDSEFETRRFGSISGGSALKFGVYSDATTGQWMIGDNNYPKPTTLENAIAIARRHRDQLLRGAELLERFPLNADDAAYAELEQQIRQRLPSIGDTAWAHKYLSLLYPTKLDDYHVARFQRFMLVKLLQPAIPPEKAGRYLMAGRFVRLAALLEQPLNHFTSVLNSAYGKPYTYWAVPQAEPLSVLPDGRLSLHYAQLTDLSTVKFGAKPFLNFGKHLRAVYPTATPRESSNLYLLTKKFIPGDIVLLLNGQTVIGLGTVNGEYQYVEGQHGVPVNWLPSPHWELPLKLRPDHFIREIPEYAVQVAIERQVLEAESDPDAEQTSLPIMQRSITSPALPPLTGLSARIQAVLERKGQLILYGPPGTGKTYWAEHAACELAARAVFRCTAADLTPEQRSRIFGRADSYVQLCSFHPAYGYEDFLEGLRPQVIDGVLTFTRQHGIFKRLCELARADAAHPYTLIIDEINRGDIPRIFGELLTVLELDKRGKPILLPLSGDQFTVPPNVRVIGTMNTADRSIALLDTALRRRFGFIELLPDQALLGRTVLNGIPLGAWLTELNRRILDHVGRDARNLQIGHAYFLEGGQPIADFSRFARVLREDILPLLEEYCYEDYTALSRILGGTLVDEAAQVIRHDLFVPGRERDLALALLEPTPELTTRVEAVTSALEAADADEDA